MHRFLANMTTEKETTMTKNFFYAIETRCNEYDDADEFVREECGSYAEMGQLFTQMLQFFADQEHDERATALLATLVRDYAAEIM